jgi:hypothetical protein
VQGVVEHGIGITQRDHMAILKIETLDTEALLRDVGPFLERQEDRHFLTRENLLTLLPPSG